MKKFILKAVLFAGLFGLLFLGVCVWSTFPAYKPFWAQVTNTTDYIENTAVKEILPAIEAVSHKDGKTKLIIGDSVCYRMFDRSREKNEDYCIAATNRGLGMSGQYILGRIYLENHPEATDIYLIITTNTLITGYETVHGYQYAVQPFVLTGYIDYLDEKTLDEMKKTYGSFVLNKQMLTFVDESPVAKKLYLNLLNTYFSKSVKMEIPDTVERNIIRLAELCESRGVTLHLLPAPIPDTQQRRELEAELEILYEKTKLYERYPDYYKNLTYYPEEYFSDGIHPDLDEEGMAGLILDIQTKNDTMKDFIP